MQQKQGWKARPVPALPGTVLPGRESESAAVRAAAAAVLLLPLLPPPPLLPGAAAAAAAAAAAHRTSVLHQSLRTRYLLPGCSCLATWGSGQGGAGGREGGRRAKLGDSAESREAAAAARHGAPPPAPASLPCPSPAASTLRHSMARRTCLTKMVHAPRMPRRALHACPAPLAACPCSASQRRCQLSTHEPAHPSHQQRQQQPTCLTRAMNALEAPAPLSRDLYMAVRSWSCSRGQREAAAQGRVSGGLERTLVGWSRC